MSKSFHPDQEFSRRVLMAGVGLTSNVLDGREISDFGRWLLILGVYDLVFLTIAYVVFDLIWEGT